MAVRSALVLLALAATAVAAADHTPGAWNCTFETKGGVKYDVSKLMNLKSDYAFMSEAGRGYTNTYFINACRSTVTTTCGPDVACCQVWGPATGGYASLGRASTAEAQDGTLPEQIKKGGFTVQFTKGSGAHMGQLRQMEIDFICDPAANPPEGTPKYGGENPMLHYNILWPTKYACPTSGASL